MCVLIWTVSNGLTGGFGLLSGWPFKRDSSVY